REQPIAKRERGARDLLQTGRLSRDRAGLVERSQNASSLTGLLQVSQSRTDFRPAPPLDASPANSRSLEMRTLLWFRGKDLRVHDHAALHAAASSREVIPLFVLSPRYFGAHAGHPAPHRLQFMLDSLSELAEGIASRGSRLCIVRGPAGRVVPK